MIFSIVILILIAVVAFFHYTQGFWSATLSAILCVIAALLAVSLHEPVTAAVWQGNLPDVASSITLVVLFAAIYAILRFLFDRAIPGNVRFPAIVDKIGGGVMGVVAGIFTTGVLVLAAAGLPFGPSLAGYARYELADERDVTVANPQGGQQIDTQVFDELAEDKVDPDQRQKLIVPVDDILLGTIAFQSSSGALSGARPLRSIHPNYADELFFDRIGIQVGANHVAINSSKRDDVTVDGVFGVTQLSGQIDAEIGTTRTKAITAPVQANPGQMFFVVRTAFAPTAADGKTQIVRLSPASVRLATKNTEDGGWQNYLPIGTLENGSFLYANKPDDFMLIELSKGNTADFVFLVDERDVLKQQGVPNPTVADGVFIEVKRQARVDLSGMQVKSPVTPGKSGVSRKPAVVKAAEKLGGAPAAAPAARAGSAAGGAPGAAAASAPIAIKNITTDARLFSPINVGTPEKDTNNAQIASGTLALKEGKLSKLDIHPTQTLTLMRQGSYAIDQLYVPPNQALVQVVAEPPPDAGADAWAWADQVTEFKLVDASGKQYAPNGAFARIRSGREDRMVAVYDASAPIHAVGRDEGRPTDIYIAFVVPSGTRLKQLTFMGKPIRDLDQAVQ